VVLWVLQGNFDTRGTLGYFWALPAIPALEKYITMHRIVF